MIFLNVFQSCDNVECCVSVVYLCESVVGEGLTCGLYYFIICVKMDAYHL